MRLYVYGDTYAKPFNLAAAGPVVPPLCSYGRRGYTYRSTLLQITLRARRHVAGLPVGGR